MEGGNRSAASRAAGFVLVGGRSSRMGRDKALLTAGSRTIAEQIAECVWRAVGNVTLIGDPNRYGFLGRSVIADELNGCGPMGGIYTALVHSPADWNLVVACDMPGVTPDLLRALAEAAGRSRQNCVVCQGPGGIEPLCAVYHRRLLPALESALRDMRLKMKDFLLGQDPELWPVADASALRNLNTPEEWRKEIA